MGPSTLSSWALLIARQLQERGHDPDVLFARAQMSTEPLRNPNARYPMSAVQRLWRLCDEATGDACFGLSVGSTWHPTSFHALGYSALASATLREALAHVARYCDIVTTGARLEVIDEDAELRVRLGSRPVHHAAVDRVARASIQAGLAAIVVLCREVRGGPVLLRRMTVTDADTAAAAGLRSFFECEVAFGAAENALVFAADEVDVPLATANPALMHVNQQLLTHYLARLQSSSLAERVRSQLFRQLPSGRVPQAGIASALNVSLRTMQRRLREEGVSFRQLLDETRATLAEHYAADSSLSTSEIAYLLGFSDMSSFTRAQRRYRQKRDSAASNRVQTDTTLDQ